MTEPESSAERRRIEHLAREYLRLATSLGRHHPMDDGYFELRYAMDHLRRADEVLQFLDRTGRDPYQTIRDIDQTLDDAHSGLVGTRDALRQNGFLDLLDDHLDTVMRCLDPEGLPDHEVELLDMLGFPHLAANVRAQTDVIAEEWRNGSARGMSVARELRQRPASSSLDNAIDHLDRHQTERREAAQRQRERESNPTGSKEPQEQAPQKGRRWWKGLGQIVQGASLAVVDVGMAVGAFKFPVSPETTTYGAVVSVSAGIGTIMNGVGDLWSE